MKKTYKATMFKKMDVVIECEADSKEEARKKIADIISKDNKDEGIILVVKEKEPVLNNTRTTVSEKSPFLQTEFSQRQIDQIDCIDNSTHDLCKVLLNNPDLNWDMNIIGDVADAVSEILVNKGYKVYYPAMLENKDGERYTVDLYNNYASSINKNREFCDGCTGMIITNKPLNINN